MNIVRFKGGLGNQMFQYAFMRAMEASGHDVGASLGFYTDFPETRRYELENVFERIYIESSQEYDEIFFEKLNQLKQEKISTRDAAKRIGLWIEDRSQEGKFQKEVFAQSNCVYVGYWQSFLYFECIRNTLKNDFAFKQPEDLQKFFENNLINKKDIVSIHIRRGDYLNADDMYGNICTRQYYEKAIKYIKRRITNPLFLFLSDDMEWVKRQSWECNAIYVEASMFKNYQNWYDMAIMSKCAHNIIANSSFSWWGAWLNQNEDKIVVAPSKWNNLIDYTDICPSGWIRI